MYKIKCLGCGKKFPKDKYLIRCPNGCDALLRTEYKNKKLMIDENLPGLWKYINWLPVDSVNESTLQYSSNFFIRSGGKFAEHLGLKNLIICYNIYNSNKEYTMRTGTFKDIEAELSFQRIVNSSDAGKTLVVSSDGNIATAFNYYSKVLKYPVLLVITEEARQNRVWSHWDTNPYLYLITLGGDSDYSDAINFSGLIGEYDDFIMEGGTRNVARRDGIGTILLHTTMKLGHMPDHYFQALGSGPGAIATYEAALRLKRDGRFGSKPPKIHASQNYPFVPMYSAWKKDTKVIEEQFQSTEAKELIKQVYAHVLTNRYPQYSIEGGVCDVLRETDGEFYSITNEEARKAHKLFKKLETVDLAPPAAVTVASLIKAVKDEKVFDEDYILLNITGGEAIENRFKTNRIKPSLQINKKYDLNKVRSGVLKWKSNLSIKKYT